MARWRSKSSCFWIDSALVFDSFPGFWKRAQGTLPYLFIFFLRRSTGSRELLDILHQPGGFWRESWSLTAVCFLSRSDERSGFPGLFPGIYKALDGWMLARAPASPAQGLHHHGPRWYYHFPHFSVWSDMRNLGVKLFGAWLVRFGAESAGRG